MKIKTEKGLCPERRKFSRVKDNIFISCHSNSRLNGKFKAVSKDISIGGLMFETERRLSKDNTVNMEIYQPVNSDKTMIFSIPVLAKISWVRKINKENFSAGENKYRVGMEFLEIADSDRRKIAEYIAGADVLQEV